MAVNSDFRDLFAALNARGARYLLVGGYAVALHAEPRYTKDLDVWVDATPENAKRVMEALADFGAPASSLSADDLARPGLVFHMGLPPNRIDILTALDGVSFADAWEARIQSRYGGEPVPVIGREQLLANKRATGRPQDLRDVELLERGQG